MLCSLILDIIVSTLLTTLSELDHFLSFFIRVQGVCSPVVLLGECFHSLQMLGILSIVFISTYMSFVPLRFVCRFSLLCSYSTGQHHWPYWPSAHYLRSQAFIVVNISYPICTWCVMHSSLAAWVFNFVTLYRLVIVRNSAWPFSSHNCSRYLGNQNLYYFFHRHSSCCLSDALRS